MASSAQIAGIPVVNDFSAGFLVGNYKNLPDNVVQIATQYSRTIPCRLMESKADFSGIFISGQKSLPLIPNVDLGFNAGVAAFYLKVEMPTLDVSVFTTFNDFSFNLGLGIYAGVHAGMSSITCTGISGDVDIIGRVTGGYNNGTFNVGGMVCGSIGVRVTQGIPTLVAGCQGTTTIFSESIGLTIGASIDSVGNKDFSFSLGGGCQNTCF